MPVPDMDDFKKDMEKRTQLMMDNLEKEQTRNIDLMVDDLAQKEARLLAAEKKARESKARFEAYRKEQKACLLWRFRLFVCE